MHPIEEKIQSLMEKNTYISIDNRSELYALPLGSLSQEFYTNIRVKTYCEQNKVHMLAFRLALEEYIALDRSQHSLEKIEAALMKLPLPMSSFLQEGVQNKAAGTYLMPISSKLICQIYRLEDIPLSSLFQKHFPIPSAPLFAGGSLPDVIQKRDAAVLKTLNKIDIKAIEPLIVPVQRRVRMKKRQQEEIHRIAQRDAYSLKLPHMSFEEFKATEEKQVHEWAEELMHDANTPYKPQCDPTLSQRILSAAKKVAAFSTVKHITSEQAIKSIFDDALYGRRTLMDFYLTFNPAALGTGDILNGDANVACLGPQDIDPKARGGIIVEFDLAKLIQNKPSAFYKQRDLEYSVDRIRQVQLGKDTLSFDHTGSAQNAVPTNTYLQIVRTLWGGLQHRAEVPKSRFISYNLEQMHEILALNFFRFMDEMCDLKGRIDHIYIDNFYQKVNVLTDEELVLFLTDLEKNMTDTAEFNIYGAHQIDFSTIINITARSKEYTLHLPKFINDLNHNTIEALRQARIKIPGLFKSHRFLDYLLLQVNDLEARYYLDDLRKQCNTPDWIKYTPLVVPEQWVLRWELHAEHKVIDTLDLEEEIKAEPSLEPIAQISVAVHQEVIKTVSEQQSSIELIQDNPFNKELFNKKLQTHQEQFDTLISALEEFSCYCGSSQDSTLLLYQSFAQELKKDFAEIGQNFFSKAPFKNKEALKISFELFQSECERLSQKAEKHVKHDSGIWSYVKPILTGFVGVVLAIAATLLTLGFATYHVAKNERLHRQYIDTFFTSESAAVRNTKNKWAQFAVKQKLFGDETLTSKGLVKEIEETLSAQLGS